MATTTNPINLTEHTITLSGLQVYWTLDLISTHVASLRLKKNDLLNQISKLSFLDPATENKTDELSAHINRIDDHISFFSTLSKDIRNSIK